MMDDRFQNQPWFVKLWRYRFYLLIPWNATLLWWWNRKDEDIDFSVAWGICIGGAQIKMKWYYTMEEMEERLFGPGGLEGDGEREVLMTNQFSKDLEDLEE